MSFRDNHDRVNPSVFRLRLRPPEYHIAAVENTGVWHLRKAGTATGISRCQILALTARRSAHIDPGSQHRWADYALPAAYH